jgi:hypothetical protein
MPFITRLLRVKNIIVYDPLANYAQTLYLKSRKTLIEVFKYGVYLMLHKLALKLSDVIIYPSNHDLENVTRMFRRELGNKEKIIISNPTPICYESIEDYHRLRSARTRDVPHFVLLAGGKGKANEEAVKLTLEVFSKINHDNFILIISGPWHDLKIKYNLPKNIILPGYMSIDELKKFLAMSDYGLSPIFNHVAGTFIKVLTYLSAGLDLIVSPQSLIGIDISSLGSRRIRLIRNIEEYKKSIESSITDYLRGNRSSYRSVVLCENKDKSFREGIKKVISILGITSLSD